VQSHFEVDVNCPACFNDVISALRATDGVELVDGHVADGCVSVTHDVDESDLQSIITRVGRTIEMAGNAEYVMGEAHAQAAHTCRRRQ
jgi:copper chaperone CopZ